MKVRCNTYTRSLIALLLLAALYGRPVGQVISGLLSSKAITYACASATDPDEAGSQDKETDKDPVLKGAKKSCSEMEPVHTLQTDHFAPPALATATPDHSIPELRTLFQKVPTQPPLVFNG